MLFTLLTSHAPSGWLNELAEQNMPHMLVYGPSGAGKKTRVMALLKGIFGNSVHKLKIDQRSFKTPSKASVDVGALLTRLRVGVPRFHIVAATPRIRPATYAPPDVRASMGVFRDPPPRFGPIPCPSCQAVGDVPVQEPNRYARVSASWYRIYGCLGYGRTKAAVNNTEQPFKPGCPA